MITRSKLVIHVNFHPSIFLNQTLQILNQALLGDCGCILRELDILNVSRPTRSCECFASRCSAAGKIVCVRVFTPYDAVRPGFLVPTSTLCGAGKLRQSSLSNCRMDWISHLPCSVTSVKLHEVETISEFTLLQFVSALENLPELEILELKTPS